jgi:serine/threonine protein kinase
MRCRAETETVDVLSGSLGAPIAILPPGTRLGSRYAIRDVLGIGGSSVVYSAEDAWTSRAVAVKVLRSDRSSEAALQRFRHEAAVAREIDCPHLVRVFDYAEGPPAYLAMELARARSLRHALKDGPLPVTAALNIAEQVLCALSVLHGRSIVHCDVKPGNILLDSGARVLLGDFELARQTSTRLEADGNKSVIGRSNISRRNRRWAEPSTPAPISTPSGLSCSRCSPDRSHTAVHRHWEPCSHTFRSRPGTSENCVPRHHHGWRR